MRGVIQKYAEKCHYYHNFNANYIIFVHNQAKFMLIWNLVFNFSNPCKTQFSSLCIFLEHCLYFLAWEWQDLPFAFTKSEKTNFLDNIVFSRFSALWEAVKKSSWNPTSVIRYLRSWTGSLWQNSPHKYAFFLHQHDKHAPCLLICTFNVDWSTQHGNHTC